MSREIAVEFLFSLKAMKEKEAAALQIAEEMKMKLLDAQPCPGFCAQMSQTPHPRIHQWFQRGFALKAGEAFLEG